MNKKNSIYTHFEIPVEKAIYSTPCTLWIPKNYEIFINSKLLIYKRFKCYLHYLILRCAPLIREGKIKPNLELKVKYQEKGIGFNIECFRPFRYSDWSVLKILANSLNVSRSCLVAMFIEMDMAGLVEEIDMKNYNEIVITNSNSTLGFRELYIPKMDYIKRTIIHRYSPITQFTPNIWWKGS